MRVRTKKLPVEGWTAKQVLTLWRQERLRYEVYEDEVTEEEVRNNVRAYVRRISTLATEEYRNWVDELWSEILNDRHFMRQLMPSQKARRCRTMDKYMVIRIIGVLTAKKVYSVSSNVQLIFMLEGEEDENTYRPFLGLGFQSRKDKRQLEKILEIINRKRNC